MDQQDGLSGAPCARGVVIEAGVPEIHELTTHGRLLADGMHGQWPD